MTQTDAFFDSNVLLYLAEGRSDRAPRTEHLLAAGGVISVQVLNEIARVMHAKWKCSWPEIREFLSLIRVNCDLVPGAELTHDRAVRYAERYNIGIFDANIVASAVLAGCITLYSEDMHDGLVIDGLTIRNPFRRA